ncbi:MAG TPA: CopD family protein [Solirubrobacteraceae bacterium]|nr:CopD family protein [Solirubrobacteraceae bacterium]
MRLRLCTMVMVTVVLAVAVLAAAPLASAHAQLLGSSPASGATVPTQPREAIFEFNQNVGGTLGAVRVYDAQGNEVDDLDVTHSDGNEHWLGVGLKPGLADGTYTATYRVVSADTHIVYGGMVFSIGHPGAAPKLTVAGLIAKDKSGKATALAAGVVRSLDYLTIALMIGGLVFTLAVWAPALATLAAPEQRWSEAARAFAGRMWRVLALAVVLGVIVSVLGVLLQGASAAGVSLWSSLKSSIVQSTLESRFGRVWAVRAIDWLLLGLVLLLARPWARWPRPATVALLALGCAYLAFTPALAGHASVESPTGAFFPADGLHVLAASVWVGGIACLLIALPAATGQLQPRERSRLLLATLARFSPFALAAVIAISLTGVIQAYIDVRSLHALVSTTYGELVLAKSALLACLVGLGWVNRRRVIPALRRLVGDARPPGAVGVLARRSIRSELALMVCVFGATAALISYVPPVDEASGPFSTNTTLGPALLEMTVEPAQVGLNTIHLYLIDAKTGSQFAATKELTATARLAAKHIGPLPLKTNPAGPGHYVLSSAVLSPGGTWQIEIVDRVSEFQQYSRVVEVPIK